MSDLTPDQAVQKAHAQYQGDNRIFIDDDPWVLTDGTGTWVAAMVRVGDPPLVDPG